MLMVNNNAFLTMKNCVFRDNKNMVINGIGISSLITANNANLVVKDCSFNETMMTKIFNILRTNNTFYKYPSFECPTGSENRSINIISNIFANNSADFILNADQSVVYIEDNNIYNNLCNKYCIYMIDTSLFIEYYGIYRQTSLFYEICSI